MGLTWLVLVLGVLLALAVGLLAWLLVERRAARAAAMQARKTSWLRRTGKPKASGRKQPSRRARRPFVAGRN